MSPATAFLTLGGLFLAGLVADAIGHRTRLPRVTLLLILGLLAGRSGFDVIPRDFEVLFGFLSTAALTMVAFLLGNALTLKKLRRNGRMILWVSLSIVAVTMVVTTAGLAVIGIALPLAVILASLACATDPAATQDVIRQTGAKGTFPDTLQGIVAIDDAWGLIVFSVALVIAAVLEGTGHAGHLSGAVVEIVGSIAVGVALGLPAAFLSGRLKPGEPMQTEALGLVFLTAGLCAWLELSFLLGGLSAGVVVANLARHHNRPFHEIEYVQWPFMMLFFLMAGATLDLEQLWALGGLGIAYVILRIAGRIAGGWIGARIAGAPPDQQLWIGPALLPQAGVAVGMALVAADSFPQYADVILTLTVGTTVLFELIGPPITRMAMARVRIIEDPPTAPGTRSR
jgi:Kef-type K+ transport system membrane component KefB